MYVLCEISKGIIDDSPVVIQISLKYPFAHVQNLINSYKLCIWHDVCSVCAKNCNDVMTSSGSTAKPIQWVSARETFIWNAVTSNNGLLPVQGQIWLDFADFKHDYTEEVYWSDMFFLPWSADQLVLHWLWNGPCHTFKVSIYTCISLLV